MIKKKAPMIRMEKIGGILRLRASGETLHEIANLWNAYLGDNVTVTKDAAIMAPLTSARSGRGGTDDRCVDFAGYSACAGGDRTKGMD